MKRLLRYSAYSFALLSLLLLLLFTYIRWGLAPEIPQVENRSSLALKVDTIGENFYRIGNCFLRKNEFGLWEEYIEGEAFERGVIAGKLGRELLYKQELFFVEQVRELIPSKGYLSFLAFVTRIFNRELDKHFPQEYKLEIYGESFSAPDEFNYIAPAYDRMLNYHAAHDIGHALQSLALVGCTSFGAWGEKTSDSSLLIGRNLDFSMGDKFAEDKIVLFCKPAAGIAFSMVTWGGFMGCVSGMNEKGLTVTINAAKSDVPNKATTPISIIAREILQYANNIEDAFALAQRRKSFVCETIMIGSAADGKTALIEKSVSKTALLQSDTNYIICANHYQSKAFENDNNNLENIATSSSLYRYQRMNELLDKSGIVNPAQTAAILRNQKGKNETDIGMSNEKALNQLISHHAVIFKPQELKMWVSANPFQLGEFVCYDLKKIFQSASTVTPNERLDEPDLLIPKDTFLATTQWQNFLEFKKMKSQIASALKQKGTLENETEFIDRFEKTNPEFWETHYRIGCYFEQRKKFSLAENAFKTALSKEIHDTRERDNIVQKLNTLQRKK